MGTSSRNMSSKSCKTVNTPREIGCISLETSTSPFYVSTRGMAVGSLGNSLVSSLVAKISILGTLSLFVISPTTATSLVQGVEQYSLLSSVEIH
jgi:NAD-dependent DNA ligase